MWKVCEDDGLEASRGVQIEPMESLVPEQSVCRWRKRLQADEDNAGSDQYRLQSCKLTSSSADVLERGGSLELDRAQ